MEASSARQIHRTTAAAIIFLTEDNDHDRTWWA
jgi:hypothetical protein